MSNLVSCLKIFENGDLNGIIKYYHVHVYNNKHLCALFVTNDDKVCGIDILRCVMTPSYYADFDKRINNGDFKKKVNNGFKKFKPINIKELSDKKIKNFFFGYDFILASSEENKLYSWGNNAFGQLGRSTDNNYDREPKEINFFTNSRSKIKQICVHMWTIMVLMDNGKVVVWGNNEIGFNGKSRFGFHITEIFNRKSIIKPKELNSLNEIDFIHMNDEACFAIDKNYNVFSWGENKYPGVPEQMFGKLGHKKLTLISKPKFSEILSKMKIITIKNDGYATYLISSDGKLYIWGIQYVSSELIKEGFNLIQIESSENFTQLEYISHGFGINVYNSMNPQEHDLNSKIVVLSDKQNVYKVKGKILIKTKYKSIEEYSVMKYGLTYKTFPATAKVADINLNHQIGRGVFGKVFKIFFQTQYYAIKRILISEANMSYLDKNCELQIWKKLKNEFIVNLYDYWNKSENDFQFLYIQMELCDQNLKDIIEEKNKSFTPIIDYMIRTEIFRQLLEALKHLHSLTPKVIHRDIKPSNVLIKYHNDHAQIKLCDFGLAKILDKESSNTSDIGTSGYRAPEILTNIYNEKVDIFSLGIMILELFDNTDRFQNVENKILNKYKNLKSVINKMIYSPPNERPSALHILNEKSEWIIESNDDVTNQIYTFQMDKSHTLLKFLEFRLISQKNGNGPKISDIDLTEEIGQGGFGKVYKVFFQSQYYAIKKILIDNSKSSYLDKNSELQIMKQLKSDFVVNLYDYWIKSENDFEYLYIQMELCDQTLKDLIDDKNISFPPVIDYIIRSEIFRQLLEALNYLHSMTPKVIHRDIKPSNVLIKYHNYHAQLKLADFGLSKILDEKSINTSGVGTAGYSAPEIRTNNYDEKVDIYSLGITILELFKNCSLIVYNGKEIYSQFNNVISEMIYRSPEERPSALEILNKKSDWLIEKNDEIINLIKKTREENNHDSLKFLYNYYSDF